MRLLAVIIAVAITTMPAASTTPAQKPKFEVVSIKPHMPSNPIQSANLSGGRVVINGFTLKMIISRAYGFADTRVFGGPSWISSDRFDIAAKAEGSISPEGFPSILQSLLEEGFQLKVHQDKTDVQIYNLVISKRGPRLELSPDQTPVSVPPTPGPFTEISHRGALGGRRGSLQGRSVPLSELAHALSNQLGTPVFDRTGLTGLYDLELVWSPDLTRQSRLNSSSSVIRIGPSLFTALDEQLGLNLESSKAPVEVLVIDSVQRPVEN